MARIPLVSDRAVGTANGVGPTSAADLLRAVVAGRGLQMPKDLVSGVGAGASTLWQLNAAQTLVVSNTSREATIDDAFECGRIAATAALAAVHATAATPLFSRLICHCPPAATDAARQALLEGVAVAMSDAGAVLADAQLIDAPTLRFDVLVAGVVRPDRVRGVAGALPGDVLILAGPLGAGIYAAAHARHKLSDDDRRVLIAHATRSSRVGISLGTIRNVHAVAGVGPTGLIAATLALARAAALPATIEASRVPSLPRALGLAKTGCVAPGSSRNWNRDGARVNLAENVMPEVRALLTDPETSGALLIACKAESVERVLTLCRNEDAAGAVVIGRLAAQPFEGEADRLQHWVTVTG